MIKSIFVLNESPVTPVGRIYKPTLRSLATRQATEGTLRKVGVTDEHCEAEVNEAAAMQAKRSVDAIYELLPIESRTEF